MTYSHVDQLSKTLKWVFIVKRGGPPLQVFEARCSDQFEGLREWKKIHSFQLTFSLLFFSLPYLFVFGSVWWIPCGSYRRVSSHETCQWGGAWAPICKYQKTNAEKYGYDTNTYISTNMDKTKQQQTYKRVTTNKIGYQKTNVKHSVTYSLTYWLTECHLWKNTKEKD